MDLDLWVKVAAQAAKEERELRARMETYRQEQNYWKMAQVEAIADQFAATVMSIRALIRWQHQRPRNGHSVNPTACGCEPLPFGAELAEALRASDPDKDTPMPLKTPEEIRQGALDPTRTRTQTGSA